MASAAMSTAAPASAPAAAAPASSDGEKGNGPPFTGRVRAYLADGPHWAWGLVLLPLLAWLWAWQRHRSLYDEAGLPRGPKL